MARTPRRIGGRFVALIRADLPGVRAGFIALLISSVGSLVTGVTLGSITGTLEALPGLIVLIPAAIGMRGNVFGALGSRLGTQIHAGTFRWSNRVETEAGQNAAAAMVSSVVVAAVLAVLAEVVSVAFGHG
ncbi:MAG: magnesium transporter, partial [Actinomycetota bacterium]